MKDKFAAMVPLSEDLTDAQVEAARVIAIEAWHAQLEDAGGTPIGAPLAELVCSSIPFFTDPDTGEEIKLPDRAWHVVGLASRGES